MRLVHSSFSERLNLSTIAVARTLPVCFPAERRSNDGEGDPGTATADLLSPDGTTVLVESVVGFTFVGTRMTVVPE